VTINNAASLQLTTGMTLEAWVYPTTVSSAWRDVIYKANDNYFLEGTSPNSSRSAAGAILGGVYEEVYGPAALTANTWAHLAATYDGATTRLYLNGAPVASQAQTGAIATSTNPLQIGGDSLYGGYFAGRIDEVRIYDRALSVAEIQSDMNTAVTPPRSPTPTPSATATATPTPTVSPMPTPTPTPCVAIVPNLLGIRLNEVQAVWQAAGFTTTVVMNGLPGQKAVLQSIPAGTAADCNNTVITVSDRRHNGR
jgi:hypothetical protein